MNTTLEQKNLYQPCPLVNSLFPLPMSSWGREEERAWELGGISHCSLIASKCYSENSALWLVAVVGWISWSIDHCNQGHKNYESCELHEKSLSLYWPFIALWATISLNILSKKKKDSDKSHHSKSELYYSKEEDKTFPMFHISSYFFLILPPLEINENDTHHPRSVCIRKKLCPLTWVWPTAFGHAQDPGYSLSW